MKKEGILLILLLQYMSSYIHASEDLSYVDGSKPFKEINDVNREAEAWATCAATFDITSSFLEPNSEESINFRDLGRGAAMAVSMTHVVNRFTKDITPKQFDALWMYSKTLLDTIPEMRKSYILADGEMLGEAGAETYFNKLAATIKVCQSNLEAQEEYIDFWREIAKSGLLVEKLDFQKPITCTYQFNQMFDFENVFEAKNESTPLIWDFSNLLTDKANYDSGGDAGSIISVKIDKGITMYLPFQLGTHTFTVWETGDSFWSKQVKLTNSRPYSQQLRGNCKNENITQ